MKEEESLQEAGVPEILLSQGLARRNWDREDQRLDVAGSVLGLEIDLGLDLVLG